MLLIYVLLKVNAYLCGIIFAVYICITNKSLKYEL